FHESFDDNEEEVVETFDREARRAAKIMGPNDIDSIVMLMRRLDRNDLADELIQYYGQERQDSPELFDLSRSAFGRVSDQALREAFAAKQEQIGLTVTLREAVETMAKGHGYSLEDQQAVERANTDDFYVVFKGPLAARRGRSIKACLQFGAQHK